METKTLTIRQGPDALTEAVHATHELARELHSRYVEKVKECHQTTVEMVQAAWDFGDCVKKAKEQCRTGHASAWIDGLGVNLADVEDCLRIRELGSRDEVAKGNAYRQAMLAVCVPSKDHNQPELSVQIAKPSHHMVLLNDFSRFKRRLDTGLLNVPTAQLREDLRPLWEWLREVYNA